MWKDLKLQIQGNKNDLDSTSKVIKKEVNWLHREVKHRTYENRETAEMAMRWSFSRHLVCSFLEYILVMIW